MATRSERALGVEFFTPEQELRIAQSYQEFVASHQDEILERNRQSAWAKELAAMKESIANSDFHYKLDKPKSRLDGNTSMSDTMTILGRGGLVMDGVENGFPLFWMDQHEFVAFGFEGGAWQDQHAFRTSYPVVPGGSALYQFGDVAAVPGQGWLFDGNYPGGVFAAGSSVDDGFRAFAKVTTSGISNAADVLGNTMFGVQTLVGGYDTTYNVFADYQEFGALSNDTKGLMLNFSIDTGVGLIGVFGGPYGALAAGLWSVREPMIDAQVQVYKSELKYGRFGPKE